MLAKVRNRIPGRNGMRVPTQPVEPHGLCLGKHFFLLGWSCSKIKNHFSTMHHWEIRLGVLAGWGLRGTVLKNQQTNAPVNHLLKIFYPHFDAVSKAIWPLECDLKGDHIYRCTGSSEGQARLQKRAWWSQVTRLYMGRWLPEVWKGGLHDLGRAFILRVEHLFKDRAEIY